MMDHRRVSTASDLARLWVHETRRVFADRLISYEDKGWFEDLARKQGEEHLGLDWDEIIGAPGTPKSFLMYADFLIPGADPKVCLGTQGWWRGWRGWRGFVPKGETAMDVEPQRYVTAYFCVF